MIRYLLDTHILIWAINDRAALGEKLLKELEKPDNILYLSRISLMEIAIKNRDGNLPLGEGYEKFIHNVGRMGVIILE